MAALPKRKYTIEEYVQILKNTEEKIEYLDGELFSMVGGTLAHAEIAGNILSVFRNRLATQSCRAYSGELAVKVPAAPPFRLPDASVVCGKPITENFHGIDLLVNPIVIVEVLSESTRKYDFSEKFRDYRTIESFTEFLLVAQDGRNVSHFVKRKGIWTIQEVGKRIELSSIGCVLTLDEIYERMVFKQSVKKRSKR